MRAALKLLIKAGNWLESFSPLQKAKKAPSESLVNSVEESAELED